MSVASNLLRTRLHAPLRVVIARGSLLTNVEESHQKPASQNHETKAFDCRYKSTLPATEDASKFVEWDGLSNGKTPTLKQVRAFPIIGSAIPALTGVPNINTITNAHEFWRAMRNTFGEFYSFGSVAGGKGICNIVHVISDPREYIKVVRAGGKFPSGSLEKFWPQKRWLEKTGMHAMNEGLHGRGEEWKRIRTFFQTDLLHPDSARGYVPGIVHAAELASKGAQAAALLQSSGEEEGALNAYLNRCSFDMFSSAMLGIYTETADTTTATDTENIRFVDGAAQGLGKAIQIVFSPYENIVGGLLKIETANIKQAYNGLDNAWEVARAKIANFIERKEKGELTENESVSYLSRALDRQEEAGSNVSVKEVGELAFTGLFAAVDTTSSVLAWNLFHIARCPDIQEKLYNEVSSSIESVGNARLTSEVLSKSSVPYLHAIIRETHRLSPAVFITDKSVNVDGLEIHGHKMEMGDIVFLETYSSGMNPELVEDPEEFRPERWLKEAVEARKDTRREVIDHPFLATPFSQGARKCPGSRVATNEILILLSQLVLDWKISSLVRDMTGIKKSRGATIEIILPNLQFEARR